VSRTIHGWLVASVRTIISRVTRLHRIASHRIASHRIASHRIASHRIASHRIASHRITSQQAHHHITPLLDRSHCITHLAVGSAPMTVRVAPLRVAARKRRRERRKAKRRGEAYDAGADSDEGVMFSLINGLAEPQAADTATVQLGIETDVTKLSSK
jgi:hypothetical protein